MSGYTKSFLIQTNCEVKLIKKSKNILNLDLTFLFDFFLGQVNDDANNLVNIAHTKNSYTHMNYTKSAKMCLNNYI